MQVLSLHIPTQPNIAQHKHASGNGLLLQACRSGGWKVGLGRGQAGKARSGIGKGKGREVKGPRGKGGQGDRGGVGQRWYGHGHRHGQGQGQGQVGTKWSSPGGGKVVGKVKARHLCYR